MELLELLPWLLALWPDEDECHAPVMLQLAFEQDGSCGGTGDPAAEALKKHACELMWQPRYAVKPRYIFTQPNNL